MRSSRADVLLKGLDLYSTAETQLYKSMLKTKPMAAAPAFPSDIHMKLNEKSQPRNLTQTNVQARLFNSQPVKKAMNDSMNQIRLSLGLDGIEDVKKKRIRKADLQQRQNTKNPTTDTEETTPEGTNGPLKEASQVTKAQDLGATQASSSDDALKYEEFKTRLAESSVELSDDDSNSIDYRMLRSTSANGPVRELSLSPSPELSDSSFATSPPPLRRVPLQEGGALKKSLKDPKATTFLPSLTMGGYWSGSEPASEEEGSVAGQPRKNRRGQRERRLIAEKKFGQKAKHLKKQGQVQDRDRGWDPRKVAETDEFGRMKRRKGSNRDARAPQVSRVRKQGVAASSGANSDPVGPRRSTVKAKPAEGPLHPSWQAAKKAKEQKKTATFQGKKVIFD